MRTRLAAARPHAANSLPVVRDLAALFVAASASLLLAVAVMTVSRTDFPLDLGWIRTVGMAGLLVTALPAAFGFLGLFLLRRRPAPGSWLVAGYSGFWSCVVLAGLPRVWNVRKSFCLEGMDVCVETPWIARLTVIATALPFLLAATWSVRNAVGARAARRRPSTGGPTSSGPSAAARPVAGPEGRSVE